MSVVKFPTEVWIANPLGCSDVKLFACVGAIEVDIPQDLRERFA